MYLYVGYFVMPLKSKPHPGGSATPLYCFQDLKSKSMLAEEYIVLGRRSCSRASHVFRGESTRSRP